VTEIGREGDIGDLSPRRVAATVEVTPVVGDHPDGDHMIGRNITRGGHYIDSADVVPCATRVVEYQCTYGHVTLLPFAADADEVPSTWDCRCGCPAHTDVPDAVLPLLSRRASLGVRGKTHYQMLCERRTLDELEALLDERLAELRSGPAPAAA
jgi:RNA polymerase-binding protein